MPSSTTTIKLLLNYLLTTKCQSFAADGVFYGETTAVNEASLKF